MTVECELCRVSKAYEVVSRRRPTRSTVPFYRIHLDLIPGIVAYNGDKYAAHFLDEATRMNEVETMAKKSSLTQIVIKYCNVIERRYGFKVAIIHTDGETSLAGEFDEWAAERGITLERSAPNTQSQNGPAERSGGVIIQKARCIRIEARLPEELHPEAYKAAAYLLNRTPSKGLGWKTPFEKIQLAMGIAPPKPNIGHLRVYGCRAYPLKYDIPRLNKLAPRAHVGYLVGYDSTNIFRIYIPSQKKVIRTRDVKFNEQLLYDDSQPDLANVLRVRADQMLEIINVRQIQDLRDELESSSDESDETLDEIQVDTDGRRQVDSGGNQEEPNIESSEQQDSSSKDDSTPGLPTPDETPEPDSLEPPPPSLSTSAKKPHYVMVPTDEAEPKKKIDGDVGEQNVVKGKRLKGRLKAYAGFLAEVTRDQTLPAQRAAFNVGLTFHKKLHRDQLPPPPRNWKELQGHQYEEEFAAAAQKEYTDLQNRGTFQVVDETIHIKTVPVIWVFTYKTDTNGYLTRFKARLCARGDLQESVHEDTYAATLAARSFRALMAIVAIFDLDCWQGDVVNAFANSVIDEVVYIKCPDGFVIKGKCLLLQRALYGLRRSPLLWHGDLTTTLKKEGLKPVAEEPCLYHNDWLIVFFYVDDITAAYRKKDLLKLETFKERLMKRYEIKDLGDLAWFLGIRIIRDRENRKLWLSQDSYIDKIATSFKVKDYRKIHTPMGIEELNPNPEQASKQDIYAYQRKVGSMLYAANITRPDVARTASKLSEFSRNPSPVHDAAATRAIAYLYQTRTLAIEYSKENVMNHIFARASDASFGDDPVSRKSTEGYLFTLFGGPIDWRSTKQKSVTKSSTEAELLALSHAATESIWWQRFFKEVGFDTKEQQVIYCDNMQTIRLLTKSDAELNTKLRHVDIHHHWLRQEVREERINIKWVPTADMTADGLTKALPRQKHETFVQQLNLVDIKDLI